MDLLNLNYFSNLQLQVLNVYTYTYLYYNTKYLVFWNIDNIFLDIISNPS